MAKVWPSSRKGVIIQNSNCTSREELGLRMARVRKKSHRVRTSLISVDRCLREVMLFIKPEIVDLGWLFLTVLGVFAMPNRVNLPCGNDGMQEGSLREVKESALGLVCGNSRIGWNLHKKLGWQGDDNRTTHCWVDCVGKVSGRKLFCGKVF